MDFRDKVYAFVRRVPRGKVTTYQAIARALGNAHLARAVGNALNKNRDFAHIPCHRVVRSDGKIGGYVFGTAAKMKKLAREGVVIQKGRVANLAKFLYIF
jgi:O-6-methylguanine DNA methyltransferase